MGKRARKTRWRALDIADDHSDSEESKTNSSVQSSRYTRSYRSSLHHSKYSYSSQSTPARRRYQYDGSTKTTRSSSTTSENKITFNEDEYTRITTPRQDVLFKKGYLNKPKSYQSQTSTGNSTISTGYSTENGTPDHQSTDLDYESQFVFPNGFVDTNGIYYVNSYEPYPLMLFNPPTYYHEFSNIKSKRYSTGSLSESMSPNNEESASQDLSQSGGEASNSVSDYSNGAPVYNMVFPGYYVNGASPINDVTNCHHVAEPVKKLKKRRERKSSKTVPGDSSENTDNSSDEDVTSKPCILTAPKPSCETRTEPTSKLEVAVPEQQHQNKEQVPETHAINENDEEEKKTASTNIISCDNPLTDGCAEPKTDNSEITDTEQAHPNEITKQSNLKPDAEEFVPRVYQPLGPPAHIKMLPPNFVPIPLVPINEFGGPNFNTHAAFIPPGFPINFIPHHPGQKMFSPVPGYVNLVPPPVHEAKIEEIADQNEKQPHPDENDKDSTATPSHTPVIEETKPLTHNKMLDLATVVSKLEEAAKLQEKDENNSEHSSPVSNRNNFNRESPKLKMSPAKKTYLKYKNGAARNGMTFVQKSPESVSSTTANSRVSPEHHSATPPAEIKTGTVKNESSTLISDVALRPKLNSEVSEKVYVNKAKSPNKIDDSRAFRNSPERFRKNWKTNGYQNGYCSPKRQQNISYNMHHNKHYSNISEKRYGDINVPTRNYSERLKKEPNNQSNQVNNSVPVQSEPVKVETETVKQTKPKINQWISVSNKKKKRNKEVEENGFETDEETSYDPHQTVDVEVFESYDVAQLVDVTPPPKAPEEQTEKHIGDILLSIAQTAPPEGQQTPTDIPKVSEIEKSIIVKIDESKLGEASLEEVPEPVNTKEQTPKADEENETFKLKKTRKGTQKPLTKKVIITDIDLSMKVEEIKAPVKKVVKKIEEQKQPPVSETVEVPAKETEVVEQTEKKSKKKRKKVPKLVTNPELSNSTTNLNSSDDSYDFLLEKGLSSEVFEKTNDEISLELDKIIQKGMYSALQEKIKSINDETESDGFFKTFDAVVSPVKDATPGFMRAPDFNRIFQSTRQFLKPNMVSVEPDISDIRVADDETDNKTSSFDPGAADSSAGPVLETRQQVQEVQEVDDDDPATATNADEHGDEDGKTLYPITQAVKDWMSRTRETTPEIDIVKSPSTIKREFGYNARFEDGVDDCDAAEVEDDEIILFSKETRDPEQPDLLEYWDDELKRESGTSRPSETVRERCSEGHACSKCQKNNLNCEDEEIEVYESKYGGNTAFKELHHDAEQTPRRHDQLPYRAVCCNLQ